MTRGYQIEVGPDWALSRLLSALFAWLGSRAAQVRGIKVQ